MPIQVEDFAVKVEDGAAKVEDYAVKSVLVFALATVCCERKCSGS